MYLQSSAGHIGAQTPVIIPVSTYLAVDASETVVVAVFVLLLFYFTFLMCSLFLSVLLFSNGFCVAIFIVFFFLSRF